MKTLLIVTTVLCASAVSSANALFAASFSLPQSPTTVSLVNGVDGFDFVPTADLMVTGLGWYDHLAANLHHDHEVGIFTTSTGTLVAPSAIVNNSSTLEPSINFRFTSVTPFLLKKGVGYSLQGFGSGPDFDPYISNPVGGFTFGTDLGYKNARSAIRSSFGFGGNTSGAIQDYFTGPNFTYTLATPEPASFAVISLGTLSLLRKRRRA